MVFMVAHHGWTRHHGWSYGWQLTDHANETLEKHCQMCSFSRMHDQIFLKIQQSYHLSFATSSLGESIESLLNWLFEWRDGVVAAIDLHDWMNWLNGSRVTFSDWVHTFISLILVNNQPRWGGLLFKGTITQRQCNDMDKAMGIIIQDCIQFCWWV